MNNLYIHSVANIDLKSMSKDGLQIFGFDPAASVHDKLREGYQFLALKYPKFYKMDDLSKLAYLTSELLFKDLELTEEVYAEMGLFIENKTASLESDHIHQKSISDRLNYAPSPSVFVYTLSNIMLGEIAIRHKIKGENYCLIFNKFDPYFMADYTDMLFQDYGMNHVLIGWVDLLKENYYSFLAYVSRVEGKWEFNTNNLITAYKNELQ